jgi:hypothetical protein
MKVASSEYMMIPSHTILHAPFISQISMFGRF